MRKLRVCLYGGTDLQGMPSAFVEELAYTILDDPDMHAVIITGGFLRRKDKPEAKSTDSAALEGAKRYAADQEKPLEECFEAWVPEPRLDGRPDVGGVVRMTDELQVKVRKMEGKTSLGRRLRMVNGIDLLVTISGKRHTEVVVEQALEIGIPVLPIPVAGGDSERMYTAHAKQIAARFDVQRFHSCMSRMSSQLVRDEPSKAAREIVELLKTARTRRCLVLCPFDGEHKAIYESTVEPAVSKHMKAVRLDELPSSEVIYASFAKATAEATAVIADITTVNPNVMYEVGFAHGQGLKPLMYTRDLATIDGLPIYLNTRNVLHATVDSLGKLIDDWLTETRAAWSRHEA